MVVTSAKSEDDSRLTSHKYTHIIQKLGFDAKFSEFKIQKTVLTGAKVGANFPNHDHALLIVQLGCSSLTR